MTQSPEIRLFTPQDKAAWLLLWKGYQAFYKTEIAGHVSDVTWKRILDKNEPVNGAFALIDGQAAGFVHYIYHRTTWTTGQYCYLQDLYVSPAMRCKGLGRALIGHVYKAAKAQKCSRVYWLTHETNHDAIQLYDRIADKTGFVQYRKLL